MELKRACVRSLLVIAAVFVIPLGIWGWSLAAPALSYTAAGSAALSLGRSGLSVSPSPASTGTGLLMYAPVSEGCRDIEAAPTEIQVIRREPVGIEAAKPSEEVLALEPYPEDQNQHSGRIEKTHYGPYDNPQFFDLEGGGQVRNGTYYTNSQLLQQSRMPPDFSMDYSEGEPLVLIYHTHATESYEPSDRDFYDSSFKSKTTDPTKSVIEVGNRICAELEKAGIPYIHDTLVHDLPSYNDAYDSSRKTVKELLEKYPSIRIVLDIHRDGIQKEDGTRIAPVAEIEGREAAQIMIISGCDNGSMGMPDHLKNFHFACALQSELETLFPTLTRPILFDYRHYNQDLTTGSLLIEVGSHGNCLDQAFYSGELIGKGLASLIMDNKE
ncbi:MAG: stage II sporulation protein P [Ruminococcus sp.]|nr:stage II sporulation protein P [Ruminococcus sp.]